MLHKPTIRIGLATALVAVLGINYAVARRQFRAQAAAVESDREHDPMRLPPAEVMSVLFSGFETLAADVAWVSCAVKYGRLSRDDPRPKFLAQNGRLVSDLDPYFHDVYFWYSATYMQTQRPLKFEEVESVNAFLDRGMQYFPTDYRLPFDAGMNYVGYIDYEGPSQQIRGYSRAIDYLERASRIDESPPRLPLTVSWLHERRMQLREKVDSEADDGSPDRFRRRHARFLSEMYYLIDDEGLRTSIETQLRETKVGRRALKNLRRAYARKMKRRHAETFAYLPVPVWSTVASLE